MPETGGHTPYIGHTWKRCPYSAWYKTNYYNNGYIGNSTNPNLPISDARITTHSDTEGTMITAHTGHVWGFKCMDDACWYYINMGRRYFES